MSIGLSAFCLQCHLRRSLDTARSLGSEQTATAFARELMKLYLAAPEDASAPWFSADTARLFHEFYGLDLDRFREEKRLSNEFVLSALPEIQRRVEQADDPVYAALQYAVLGNYIDYSALEGEVSMETFGKMLSEGEHLALDRENYRALCRDLSAGGKLLYLTDNAGEIGFDRVLAQQIHRRYPQVDITFCVRGGPALNDATREDAAAVGIPFPVIDSGAPISGTVPERLGQEAREAFSSADVILSKGQGNAETLLGCGKNVYYAFLIKCAWFRHLFGKEKFTPMLLRDCQWLSAK